MQKIPEWIPAEEWAGFIAMRTKIKKVPTDRAIELLIMKLEKLRDDGEDVGQVLDQSTMGNYQGLFPVRQDKRAASRNTGPDMSRLGKAGQATANNAMDWLEGV